MNVTESLLNNLDISPGSQTCFRPPLGRLFRARRKVYEPLCHLLPNTDGSVHCTAPLMAQD